MVTRVNNKDIHRYKYTRRKVRLKGKVIKKADISFGYILETIEMLKAKGLIDVSNVDSSISNSIKNSTNK